MPQISAFTLCSEIVDNVSGEGILEPELRNPQPALRPRFIPTEYSFGVYLGILGIGPESDNELEFRLDDADGKTVTQIGPITVPTTAPTFPLSTGTRPSCCDYKMLTWRRKESTNLKHSTIAGSLKTNWFPYIDRQKHRELYWKHILVR